MELPLAAAPTRACKRTSGWLTSPKPVRLKLWHTRRQLWAWSRLLPETWGSGSWRHLVHQCNMAPWLASGHEVHFPHPDPDMVMRLFEQEELNCVALL